MSRAGRRWKKPVWLDLDKLPRLYLNNRPLGEDEIKVLSGLYCAAFLSRI